MLSGGCDQTRPAHLRVPDLEAKQEDSGYVP